MREIRENFKETCTLIQINPPSKILGAISKGIASIILEKDAIKKKH